jgi:hypothetical protein
MKHTKYLLVASLFFCCGMAGRLNAQTVQFLGGGAPSLFLELGQAAQSASSIGTPCVWTQGPNSDISPSETYGFVALYGNIWVTWSAGSTGTCAAPSGSGINVYAYMSAESASALVCFFEVEGSSGNSGCVLHMTIAAGTVGANLLCAPSPANCTSFGPDTPIPQVIINAVNGQNWFVAGTDIRPEDAVFAFNRATTGCQLAVFRQPFDQGLREVYGMGYEEAPGSPDFTTVESSFPAPPPPSLNFFQISGLTITGGSVRNFSVSNVGAQPIVVVVGPVPAGGTGIAAATDVTGFTLTGFLQGVLGRSTDLRGPTTTNPVTTLVREPFSGAYNVMEYSVPNSSQFHASQDDVDCFNPPQSGQRVINPMTLQSTNGQILAFRKRVIGNDQMVAQLAAATSDTLGYFFWNAANASNFTASNAKYLKVNGVDPLLNQYIDGVLPGVDSAHPLSNVTFKSVNMGDYPLWSALRLISTSPAPASVTNLVAAVQTLSSTQYDFIPISNLTVWHSHFSLPTTVEGVTSNGTTVYVGVGANGTTINPATPGDLCSASGALAEVGAEAGGANVLKVNNADFCADFGSTTGFINRTN